MKWSTAAGTATRNRGTQFSTATSTRTSPRACGLSTATTTYSKRARNWPPILADPLHPVPAPGSRAYPDGEIVKGTFIPAVIPIPTNPMAPMPGKIHIADGAATGYRGGQIVYDEPDKNAGYPSTWA